METENKDEHNDIISNKVPLVLPDTMRRVDWRWAVQKGYLDKETNTWNEEMGGKEAYLMQRNERMHNRCKISLIKACSNRFKRII